MTPQERELITELFDRLASLEGSPRDGEAERAIAEGLARAPHAIYPLVQTVLVQDEALRRANARIQELEGSDGGEGAREGGSFLDSMRGALFGRDSSARGSVPSVPPGSTSGQYAPPPGPGYAPSPGYAPAPGGSFLGTAAASAAGIIGGSLLLDSIRSMFGQGHAHAGAYEPVAPAHSSGDDRGAANSDLAREAGTGDVNAGSDEHQHSAGSFDTAGSDNDNDNDYNDYSDDDDDGDDSDFAGGDFDGGDVA
jgi:uncharacterized protein